MGAPVLAARGFGAGFIFSLSALASVVGAAMLGLNGVIGERTLGKTAIVTGAILFACWWYGMYNVHDTAATVILFMGATTGTTLWLWGARRISARQLDRR